jgi:uncharacterized protein
VSRLFVTGRNEWSATEALEDPAGAKKIYLDSDGGSNTRLGNGRLIPDVPSAGRPLDRFQHDPARPVPWQPAGVSFSRSKSGGFTLDTAFLSARDDVLVYDSEPVEESLIIVGRPEASLWVGSSADDSDWIVGICDLFPGAGRAIFLSHGVARLGAGATPPAAGGVAQVDLELSPIAHELLPGHSIRLLVCSSLFPLYAVNPGSSDYIRAAEARTAEHFVAHDEKRPSSIELPIATTATAVPVH